MKKANQQITRARARAKINVGDNKNFKVKAIYNSVVYIKEVVGQLPGLYYLVSSKSYIEEKNF